MPNSTLSLLMERRAWPLVLSQSCGALNDNMVKNAMVILALFQLSAGGAGLSALAGALFIAPYALISATAGKLADSFSKPRVIVACKLAEIFLMIGAAIAFASQSIPGLLAVLVGLGIQSALFSPVKYGLLPEHLAENELVAGNGLIEASTFLSIVIGTIMGGGLVILNNGTYIVGGVGIFLALVGFASALKIPTSPAAAPNLRLRLNVFSETNEVIRLAHKNRTVWLSLLALSWFWTIGATLMTEFPVLVRDTLHTQSSVMTMMLAVFALGTGAGSIGCARLLKGEVSPRYVPFACLGLSLFCWDFASTCSAMSTLAPSASVQSLLAMPNMWRIGVDLFLLAACGGAFSVPLYALMQDYSPSDECSRMIAANNIMNAVFMVFGAGATAALSQLGMSAPDVLKIAAIANLAVAFWIVRIIPHEVYRTIFRSFFAYFHGVEIEGLENYKAAGDKVVIIANHQSYADACLIASHLPGNPTFAIHSKQLTKWWVRMFTAAVDVFPVDVQSPYSVKLMVEAVRDQGRKLMIFPEGRLTRTGNLMRVFDGAGLVADKAGAKVLPITIEGLQFSPLGHMAGKYKIRWFPKLRMTVHPAIELANSDEFKSLTPRERRDAIGRRLHDVMINASFAGKQKEKTLFAAVLDARDTHGGKKLIAEDVKREPISYNKVILGAAVLGRRISQNAEVYASRMPDNNASNLAAKYIGILLPNSNATLVTFLGLQAFGKVCCMLNFSAGADAMLSACLATGAKTVVSSRSFVEKAKLEDAINRLEKSGIQLLWLEDLKEQTSLADKIRGKWDVMHAHNLPGNKVSADDQAVVLFTSGSEGKPKGVVHSHKTLLSNVAQLSSVIDFHGGDILFNVMPCFHSFGLTGGMLVPLISGVMTFHYPSPLHYRIVPRLIYDTNATICFGTDTFLNGWAKYAHPYDFYAMRYIFAGAEKVREETKRLYAEKFGVRILEGYGATETAPALAMNTAMNCKAGTVGRFLPGIKWELEEVPGIDAGGRLLVRGPNIMLGYMRETAPGVLEAPENGTYDTGDIVSISPDGFVSIEGRAKRFAKIAGEKVSMTAAENLASSTWPGDALAVIKIPDARKGEALVLVTTNKLATTKDLLAQAKSRGIAEILVPRSIVYVDTLPLLGTGKVNYPAVESLVVDSKMHEILKTERNAADLSDAE